MEMLSDILRKEFKIDLSKVASKYEIYTNCISGQATSTQRSPCNQNVLVLLLEVMFMKDHITLRKPFLNLVKPVKNEQGFVIRPELDIRKVTADLEHSTSIYKQFKDTIEYKTIPVLTHMNCSGIQDIFQLFTPQE